MGVLNSGCVHYSVYSFIHLILHMMNLVDWPEQRGSLTTVVLICTIRALLNAVAMSLGRKAGAIGAEEAVTPHSHCKHRIM